MTENIRNLRRLKDMSQEAIAYELGIDYSTYGKIERGEIALTIERMEKLARIFGLRLEELYYWGDEKANLVKEPGPKYTAQKSRLKECQLKLEAAQQEIEALKARLRDKEEIIALLKKDDK